MVPFRCSLVPLSVAARSLDKINTNQHLFHFFALGSGECSSSGLDALPASSQHPSHLAIHPYRGPSRYAFHLSSNSPIHHPPHSVQLLTGERAPSYQATLESWWIFSFHLHLIFNTPEQLLCHLTAQAWASVFLCIFCVCVCVCEFVTVSALSFRCIIRNRIFIYRMPEPGVYLYSTLLSSRYYFRFPTRRKLSSKILQ